MVILIFMQELIVTKYLELRLGCSEECPEAGFRGHFNRRGPITVTEVFVGGRDGEEVAHHLSMATTSS